MSVSVAAAAPFAGLRLTGTAQPAARDRKAGVIAYVVAVRSVKFCGTVSALVSVDQYQAATPDPLWREAPGILRHLEQGHMSDLIGCVRAHGMRQADWVIRAGPSPRPGQKYVTRSCRPATRVCRCWPAVLSGP